MTHTVLYYHVISMLSILGSYKVSDAEVILPQLVIIYPAGAAVKTTRMMFAKSNVVDFILYNYKACQINGKIDLSQANQNLIIYQLPVNKLVLPFTNPQPQFKTCVVSITHDKSR
jgi:hypothetical protein